MPENKGLNFAGYTIGWAVALAVGLPFIALLCCGVMTCVGLLTDTGS
jgi:hypothetical protein